MSSIIIIYIYKCTISQKKALMLTCFSPFITVVRHICMCYTSYIRPLTASLYYARHTTNSLSTYSKKSVLRSGSSLVDEVFNDSDQMMVRSAAKHITFIASNLKLLLRHQKYCDPESTQSTVQVCEQQRNFVSSLTCVFFAGD